MAVKEKHDWSQFKLKIFINKPVSKVFQAWTDEKILTEWFPVKTILEPRKGGHLYFEWLWGDKLDTKVISIAKNKSITFPFGSKGEKVRVRVKKEGLGCICEIHQYDMKISPESKWSMHKGCEVGWAFFLANLKAYLEHGIDLRSHDKKYSYRSGYVNS